MKSDAYQQLLAEVKQAGATLEMTGSGHWKICKNGTTVFAPATPSDFRSIPRVRSKLQNAGILPRRTKRYQPSEEDLLFLRRFEGVTGLRVLDGFPRQLEAKGLINVSNRYKHGKLDGWMIHLTDKGRAVLEAHYG